ncbi:putative dna methyltransferase 1-associated protein dmap1 protein [Lasiodiplodia theobromae]|nr:putative dna methyltransferase 1-associated protein dmap1 protein [Lasiodiplodia theobromae]
MASMNDARDIMGLQPGEALPKPPPAKKQKTAQPKPRITGINREVQALYGERAPPVAVVEAGKSYQPKRRWGANKGPAAKWALTPFTNPARTDDLILRHWRRLQPNDVNGDVAMGDAENQDGGAAAAATAATEPRLETNYEYAKFNIQPEGPEYDDETYEAHLRSEEWSKEETDYLVETVKDYYHRWAIIADRYDWQPAQPKVEPDAAEGGAVAAPAIVPKPRTMEDLKARYYQISAKLMELKTPIASMTNAEFGLHEILTRFDPDREKQRKKVAAALLERTADEIKEEQYLLGELQRINTNYEKLSTERDEVRQRLFAPPTQGSTSTASQFQSSHALSQLFNQLLQQDRSKKRNGRLSLNTADQISTPSGQQTPMTAGGNRGDGGLASANSMNKSGRQSINTPGASGNQQGSGGASGSSAQQHHPSQPPRTLTPRAMQRLGVTHHDRLSSGVTFKSDRLHKLRMAKSTIQTQKIQQALAELRIPEIIALPTSTVCDEFEVLINKIHRLLDLRKLLDKEESEQQQEQEGAEGNADGEVDDSQQAQSSAAAASGERKTKTEQGDTEMMDASPADAAEEDGAGMNGVKEEIASPAPLAEGGGRSASVASQGSGAGGKRNKK